MQFSLLLVERVDVVYLKNATGPNNHLSYFLIFSRFDRFFRYFAGKGCNRRKNYCLIVISDSKINAKRCFVFRVTQILILTIIFAILVGHIELKTLTEKAGLQSHTLSYAQEHNMSN